MSTNRYNKIKIKKENGKNNNSLIALNETTTRNKNIVFSFLYFQKESIKYKDFNNMYENKLESVNAVSDLFETVKDLSGKTFDELCANDMKKQYHFNVFDEKTEEHKRAIDKIEEILIKGYKIPKAKVEEFERLYMEFQFKNGKRVIGTIIEGYIFSILFLDPNHLICESSSRDVNKKKTFFQKGAFEKWSKEDFYNYDAKELLDEMQVKYENEEYADINDMDNDLKDIIYELSFMGY